MLLIQGLYNTVWAEQSKDPAKDLATWGAIGVPLVNDGGNLLKSKRELEIGFTGNLPTVNFITRTYHNTWIRSNIRQEDVLVIVAKDGTTLCRGLDTLAKYEAPKLKSAEGSQLGLMALRYNGGGGTSWVGGALQLIGSNAKTGAKIVLGSIGTGIKNAILEAMSDPDTVDSPQQPRTKEQRREALRRAFSGWDSVVDVAGREGRLRSKCAILAVYSGVGLGNNVVQRISGAQSRSYIGSEMSPALLASNARSLFFGKQHDRSGGMFD